jgi:hypothetical protein
VCPFVDPRHKAKDDNSGCGSKDDNRGCGSKDDNRGGGSEDDRGVMCHPWACPEGPHWRGLGVPVTLGLVPRIHAGGSVCPFVDPRHKAKDDMVGVGPRMTIGGAGPRMTGG